MNENENRLISDIRETLNRSVENLDQELTRKLNQIRQCAIDTPQRKKKRLPFWSPAIPVAIVLLIVVISQPTPKESLPADPALLELPTEQNSLEFFEYDMEFYLWLSEEIENENNSSTDTFADRVGNNAALAGDCRGKAARRPGTDCISGRIQG